MRDHADDEHTGKPPCTCTRSWLFGLRKNPDCPLTGHSGHSDCVMGLAFDPAGTLASCSLDKSIIVWDTDTGLAKFTLRGHNGKGDCICTEFWGSGGCKSVRPDCPVKGHSDAVLGLAFDPAGTLASCSADKSIIVWLLRPWDTDTGLAKFTLTGHSDRVSCLAISGNVVVSGSYDQTIRRWDIRNGESIGSPLGGLSSTVYSVAFSPVGDVLASGSGDSTIRIWDVESGKELRSLMGHDGDVNGVAWSKDSSVLASCSDDRTVKLQVYV